MKKILHLDASGRHQASLTRQLSKQTVDAISRDGDHITYRDIGQGLPFVNDMIISSYFTSPQERTVEQKQAVALSDEMVKELQDHDTYVIGVPVYNFSMPAAFKAWADLVARAGLTFKYTENGPVGLLANKKAYVVIASGGTLLGSEIDYLSPWLKFYLSFLGVVDVEVIAATGTKRNIDEVVKAAELQIASLK
jgi:FMN-dependent NADH-azoreductase